MVGIVHFANEAAVKAVDAYAFYSVGCSYANEVGRRVREDCEFVGRDVVYTGEFVEVNDVAFDDEFDSRIVGKLYPTGCR